MTQKMGDLEGVKNDKDEDDGTNSDLNNTQSKPRKLSLEPGHSGNFDINSFH